MAPRRPPVGKVLILPLLLFNILVAFVVLVMAGWYIDHFLSYIRNGTPVFGDFTDTSFRHVFADLTEKGFRTNEATLVLIPFALIAGVVAVASYIVGLHHVQVWTLPSLAAAQAAAWIALLLLLLPFGFAWKELALKHRGEKLVVLEVLIFVLTIAHLAYTVLLYSPNR